MEFTYTLKLKIESDCSFKLKNVKLYAYRFYIVNIFKRLFFFYNLANEKKNFSIISIAILDCIDKLRHNYDDDMTTELTHIGACYLPVVQLGSSYVLVH